MRKLLLLRPEPGLSTTAKRSRELGLEVIACPLFRVEPVAWEAPAADAYDGLLVTSANAIRHGGAQLATLKSLPVHAVGPATAAAAREAGFKVETVGERDVQDLLDRLTLPVRLLHLAGEDHRRVGCPEIDRRIVYRSAAIEDPGLPALEELVVAVHSPRAGGRISQLTERRSRTAIAAISDEAAQAAGSDWERVAVAEQPNDASLLALAAMLCHTSPSK